MPDKLDALLDFTFNAFQAENEVIEHHDRTAEKYFGVIGLVLGFHIVEMKEIVFSDGPLRSLLSVVSLSGMGFLLVALVVALLSIRIRTYPTFPETKDLAPLRNQPVTNEDAKGQLVDVYLRLRDAILQVNQRRARLLRYAGVFLLLGFFLSIIGQSSLKFLSR